MTSRPEPMSAEERAREICITCPHIKFYACAACIAIALREYGEAARAEGLIRGFDKGLARGFYDCQSKVMEIVEPTDLDDKSYARIRALTPSEESGFDKAEAEFQKLWDEGGTK